MFLAVCLNPTLQKTIVVPRLFENEVNRATEHYLDASGKGVNVARVLTQLGECAIQLTHSGGRNRALFHELAARDKVTLLDADSASEIRFCYTVVSRENHTTTELVEEGEPVAAGTESRVWEQFERALPEVSVVTFSGSRAGGYSDNLFAKMTERATAAGKTVLLDIRGAELVQALRYRPDFIMPNLAEFATTFLSEREHGHGLAVSEHTDDPGLLMRVKEKMQQIYRSSGTVTVLTRGARDTLFVDAQRVRSARPQQVEPVNTIGCGDAFTAGFAARIAHGGAVSDAVDAGHRTAAQNAVQVRPGRIK